MIHDKDRKGHIGASDSHYVVASHRAKTWNAWWDVKTGKPQSFEGNRYTKAGELYEHAILQAISPDMNLDRQLNYPDLSLRVNYDGDLNGVIYEVKTHKIDKRFEVSRPYWQQAQVEIFAYKLLQEEEHLPEFKRLWIVSYGLYPPEYDYQAGVEFDRIRFHEIAYDPDWIDGTYLPKLRELSEKLKQEVRELDGQRLD